MRKSGLMISYAFMFLMFPCAAIAEGENKIPPALQKKYDLRQQEMNSLDLNKDGILQAKELRKKPQETFDSKDINKDGILSADEINAIQQDIQKKSSIENNDNVAKKQAMKAKIQLKNADRNEDGIVSQQEYESYYGQRYQNFDQDGDGVVTEKEYRTDLEKLPSAYRKDSKD